MKKRKLNWLEKLFKKADQELKQLPKECIQDGGLNLRKPDRSVSDEKELGCVSQVVRYLG